MPRSSSGLWIAVVLMAAGCARPPEGVHVDLSQVPAEDPVPPARSDLPPAPLGWPGTQASLRARSADTLDLGDATARIEAAQGLVDESRRLAYEQVLRSLRESYRAEVQRWANGRLGELSPIQSERYGSAIARIMALFEPYAAARGPLIARLAFLAGFPDADPQSKRQPEPGSPQALRSFAEAKRLRAQIGELDEEFAAGAARALREVETLGSQDEALIRSEIEAAFAGADARAEREASDQMTVVGRQLDAVLAGRTSLPLPAEPGAVVRAPASAPLAGAPVPARPEFEPVDLARERDIWLRARGYTLAPKGVRARDVTEEFVAWREAQRVGH